MRRGTILTIVVTAVLTLNLMLLLGTGGPEGTNEEKKEEGTTEAAAPKADKTTQPLVSNQTHAIKIPQKMDFAGEEVPLHDHSIKERLDREMLINTYWHSSTIYLMKQSSRYFPVIEPILQSHGVPNDFKYLAVAESGLQNVVSPSKAVGVWQFISSTAKKYDLEVNSEVDERYHLEKATKAACEYLKEAKEKFGSWTMAAAAYNMGMDGLRRHVESQGEDAYYDLFMNRETSRYVFRILAFKEIFSNPKTYGFHLDEEDLYPPHSFVEVPLDTAVTNLAAYAHELKINYKVLKEYNPWLRRPYLKNKYQKTYHIRIPS